MVLQPLNAGIVYGDGFAACVDLKEPGWQFVGGMFFRGTTLSFLGKAKRMLDERRAREAINVASPVVVRTIAGLQPAERSAVMIVAHAMLRDATIDYGKDVIGNPMKLPKTEVAEVLGRLGAAHRKLTASLAAVADHVAGDTVYKGTLRQIRATEVVIVTVGMAWDRALVVPTKQVWKSLWAARTHAVEAVRLIMAFQVAIHERALPASEADGPERMARLATTLPAMFRPKGLAAPPAKPALSAAQPAAKPPVRKPVNGRSGA